VLEAASVVKPSQPCDTDLMLVQTIDATLASSRRVLLAGCGGGYDVLGAVPLLVELLADGREVHLASHSFCYLNGLPGARQIAEAPSLYEVPAAAATEDAYCPEAWLARWLEERLGLRQPVWAFDKTGVQPLHAGYRVLVERLGIDALVLIDGGIDAVLRGDESSLGTPSEDLASLAAVRPLAVQTKLLACVGLGAELRDGICHEQVFRRIAELARCGGYLGAAALTPQSEAGARYRDAVSFIFANQQRQRRSHVHKVIAASLEGQYGSDGPHVWLSPLLPLYWFFALEPVASSNVLLDALWETMSIWDVIARIEARRKSLAIQERTAVPL
jgi:hypothetical protein